MEKYDKPQLFVLSGGNGAGKSTFTKDIVPPGTVVINGDLIRSQFKTIQQAELHTSLLKQNAIKSKNNVSLETNFLFKDEIRDFLEFKDMGYEINLYYIALKDLEESRKRVDVRVRQGGHFVDEYNRELSFNIGLENSVDNANQFDRVTVIANSFEYQEILLIAEKKQVLYKDDVAPEWAKDLINQFENGIKNDIDHSNGYKR